tara:strand:- start:111 stop:479 length:369 start_codon:yes stop_codon:yes gene_type:complete
MTDAGESSFRESFSTSSLWSSESWTMYATATNSPTTIAPINQTRGPDESVNANNFVKERAAKNGEELDVRCLWPWRRRRTRFYQICTGRLSSGPDKNTKDKSDRPNGFLMTAIDGNPEFGLT